MNYVKICSLIFVLFVVQQLQTMDPKIYNEYRMRLINTQMHARSDYFRYRSWMAKATGINVIFTLGSMYYTYRAQRMVQTLQEKKENK